MVSLLNVGRFTAAPLPKDWTTDAGRKIATPGPLYPPDDVRQLLAKGVTATCLFTTRARDQSQDMGMNLKDVSALVAEALEDGKYKGSEWCKGTNGGPIAACDAYSLKRRVTRDHQTALVSYYVKFAILKTGTLLLIFSCHD